jgi:hypothetical protein
VALLTALVWVASTLTATAQPAPLDRILAIVAGNVIMHSDVRAFIDLGLTTVPSDGVDSAREAAVLTELIDRRLVLDEVERYGVSDPPGNLVDERLASVRARFPTSPAYQTALARVGIPEPDLRQLLRDDLRRDSYLAERFPPAQDLAAGRRDEMIAQWIDTLQRRGQVRRVFE